jgi:hypothetical protein
MVQSLVSAIVVPAPWLPNLAALGLSAKIFFGFGLTVQFESQARASRASRHFVGTYVGIGSMAEI